VKALGNKNPSPAKGGRKRKKTSLDRQSRGGSLLHKEREGELIFPREEGGKEAVQLLENSVGKSTSLLPLTKEGEKGSLKSSEREREKKGKSGL